MSEPVVNECDAWAAKWHAPNDESDGHFLGDGFGVAIFATRAQCRAWIEERYGYIKRRADLRAAPFFWRMPRAVRVRVTVGEMRSE